MNEDEFISRVDCAFMNVVYFACSSMESEDLDDECQRIREQRANPG